MADRRIETIERLWAAMSRLDVPAIKAELAAGFIADWTRSRGPDAGMYRGVDASVRFLTAFAEAFESFHWEHETIDLVGRDRALFASRFIGRRAGSGLETIGRGAQLAEFADHKLARLMLFQSLPEAHRHLRLDRLAAARLYFVCEGRPGAGDPEPLLEAALAGGVDVVQLREKAPRCAEEMVALAEPFRRAADAHEALFFVNDDPDLVEPCGADGVHLGQDDTPVATAREVTGAAALIGLSTHSAEQFDTALAAEEGSRPDQVSVGPIWETPTKAGRPATGLGLVEHAAAHGGKVAWFAIGGIDESNVGQVVEAGATRAVVVRAIRDAADPEAAARELRKALDADG